MEPDKMSNDDIRKLLSSRGVKCGPISSTTRNIYVRKLTLLLEKDNPPENKKPSKITKRNQPTTSNNEIEKEESVSYQVEEKNSKVATPRKSAGKRRSKNSDEPPNDIIPGRPSMKQKDDVQIISRLPIAEKRMELAESPQKTSLFGKKKADYANETHVEEKRPRLFNPWSSNEKSSNLTGAQSSGTSPSHLKVFRAVVEIENKKILVPIKDLHKQVDWLLNETVHRNALLSGNIPIDRKNLSLMMNGVLLAPCDELTDVLTFSSDNDVVLQAVRRF